MTYPVINESFNAGVLSPTLDGQNRIEPKERGLQAGLNFLARVEGSLFYRGGTKLVAMTKDNDVQGRILPFVFSTEQAYIIDAGEKNFRFIMGDGPIIKLVADSETWELAASYEVDDYRVNNAALYRCILDHTATADDEPGTGANWATYWETVADGAPYEISSVYGEADLPNVRRTQSADVFFTADGTHTIKTLSRYDHDEWKVGDFETEDGPYLDQNKNTAHKIAASATSGTVTLTASGSGNAPFKATDVGRHIRLRHGDVIGWGVITAYTSATQVTCAVKRNFSATTATEEWRLGAWSETTGYPRNVTFINESFAAAATRTQSQTHWKSAADDIYDFAPTDETGAVTDANAYAKDIGGSDQVNPIYSVSWAQYLILLTGGGAWRLVTAGNESITPENGTFRLDCGIKAADIDPVRIGPTTVFVQKDGKKIYKLQYQFENDGLTEEYLSRLARTLFAAGIKEIALQESPDPYLWCLLKDGTLVAMLYEPGEKVVGCFPVTIGGNGVVESIAVIPGSNDRDNLYLRVKRELAGGTYRTIERMRLGHTPYEPGLDDDEKLELQKDCFFVDCGVTYDGEPTDTIAGLEMFNGETVAILADGAVHPKLEVADGKITLQREASKVHVGFGYFGYAAPARREFDLKYGSSHGKKKRMEQAGVMVRESGGIKYGPSLESLIDVPLGKTNRVMDRPTPLFTGEIPLRIQGDWRREFPDLYIAHDSPLPCEIQRIDRFISVEDK